MLGISDLFGGEEQALDKLKRNIGFGIHCSMPAIIQSYNPVTQTVECQPAIRERMVSEEGIISYIQYPLLINVPVVFPQTANYSITFPIQKGDECLVVFSDVPLDGWWVHGNVQNPIEQRRHDLSDGLAIVGIRNQEALTSYNPATTNALLIQNRKNQVSIKLDENDVTFTVVSQGGNQSISISQLLQKLEELEDRVEANEDAITSTNDRITSLHS